MPPPAMAPRPQGIVADLFPGVELPTAQRGPLEASLRRAATRLALQPTDYFMTKVRPYMPTYV